MSPDSTKTILRIGFGVSLGMMFTVALIALSVLHTSNKRIEQLVNANNTKSNLIHQMRSAARERMVNLQNMLILDDPFHQDEERMFLNANGAAFAQARLRLLAILSEGAAQAVQEAERNYRSTLIATLVLMLGITGLSMLIARFVTRRTTEAQDRLYAATEYAPAPASAWCRSPRRPAATPCIPRSWCGCWTRTVRSSVPPPSFPPPSATG